MTKVSELIKSIRYILVDAPSLTEARGWSDDRLVDLIDEAQKDICKSTGIFKKEHYISLAKGMYTYPLPDDFIKADRFMDWERKIPELTMYDLDAKNATWRNDEGDRIEAIVQDSVNMNFLEVYPVPQLELTYIPFYTPALEGTQIEYVLFNPEGVTVSMDRFNEPPAEFDSVLGVYLEHSAEEFDVNVERDVTPWGAITGSELVGYPPEARVTRQAVPMTGVVASILKEIPTSFGIWGGVTSLHQAYGSVGGTWGIVCSVASGNAILSVRYSALTETLNEVDGNLTLPDKWDALIKYYVAGYALLDDSDAKNNQKGTLFLQRYNNDLKSLSALGDSTDAAKSATSYRRLGKSNYTGDDYGYDR